jgi:rhodanese-related sulfurtransferase
VSTSTGIAIRPGRGIDVILAEARARLHRPAAQRAAEGEIPGSLVIERNVLEWRFDPRSDARLDIADRYDLPVVVFCSEGYTSSLAAAALQDLGLHRATDLAGGFHAWKAAGHPVSGGVTTLAG